MNDFLTGLFAGQLSGDLRGKDYYCPANVDQSVLHVYDKTMSVGCKNVSLSTWYPIVDTRTPFRPNLYSFTESSGVFGPILQNDRSLSLTSLTYVR